MSIWLPPTAEHQPEVVLVSWSAFEVLVPRLGKPTIHVAGVEEACGDGRVSSPVCKVDAPNRSVVTSTGRTYRLVGPAGLHGNAEYVWQRWVHSWDAEILREAASALLNAFNADEAHCGGPR